MAWHGSLLQWPMSARRNASCHKQLRRWRNMLDRPESIMPKCITHLCSVADQNSVLWNHHDLRQRPLHWRIPTFLGKLLQICLRHVFRLFLVNKRQIGRKGYGRHRVSKTSQPKPCLYPPKKQRGEIFQGHWGDAKSLHRYSKM